MDFSPSRIEAQVLAFCRQAGLFLHGEKNGPLRVAAAVSGGADSMALLRLLWALRADLGLEQPKCLWYTETRFRRRDAPPAKERKKYDRN